MGDRSITRGRLQRPGSRSVKRRPLSGRPPLWGSEIASKAGAATSIRRMTCRTHGSKSVRQPNEITARRVERLSGRPIAILTLRRLGPRCWRLTTQAVMLHGQERRRLRDRYVSSERPRFRPSSFSRCAKRPCPMASASVTYTLILDPRPLESRLETQHNSVSIQFSPSSQASYITLSATAHRRPTHTCAKPLTRSVRSRRRPFTCGFG